VCVSVYANIHKRLLRFTRRGPQPVSTTFNSNCVCVCVCIYVNTHKRPLRCVTTGACGSTTNHIIENRVCVYMYIYKNTHKRPMRCVTTDACGSTTNRIPRTISHEPYRFQTSVLCIYIYKTHERPMKCLTTGACGSTMTCVSRTVSLSILCVCVYIYI